MEERGVHPILSVYGQTEKLAFPLILIIGREPNSGLEMGHEVGTYEFGKGGVPFWDIPYSILAEYIGLKGRELKCFCRCRNNSPITFADISDKPIHSNDNNKSRKRNERETEDFVNHLTEVEQLPIFKRVKSVIFSGLDYPLEAKGRYGEALIRFEKKWDDRDIETVRVRFPRGSNRAKIKEVLDSESTRPKEILNNWRKCEHELQKD